MTIKEKRAEDLDALKNSDSLGMVVYRVEILNSAFQPFKIYAFNTIEEANKAYDQLEYEYFGGFLRKYAYVPF